MDDPVESVSSICKNCNKCEYFAYCGKNIPSPSPFDVYDLDFPVKCQYYNDDVAFEDIPKLNLKLKELSPDELEQLRQDLETYGALDTLAVVKILKKLYETSK